MLPLFRWAKPCTAAFVSLRAANFATTAVPVKSRPSTDAGATRKRKLKEEGITPRVAAVMQMLLKPDKVKAVTEREVSAKRLEYYAFSSFARQQAWQRDMQVKHQLQLSALLALPPSLRKAAETPDMSPFPPSRNFMFDTPPAAYIEP
ncbi:hypothetical protein V8C86DRAFT_2460644 [Haematococcus lacustris]